VRSKAEQDAIVREATEFGRLTLQRIADASATYSGPLETRSVPYGSVLKVLASHLRTGVESSSPTLNKACRQIAAFASVLGTVLSHFLDEWYLIIAATHVTEYQVLLQISPDHPQTPCDEDLCTTIVNHAQSAKRHGFINFPVERLDELELLQVVAIQKVALNWVAHRYTRTLSSSAMPQFFRIVRKVKRGNPRFDKDRKDLIVTWCITELELIEATKLKETCAKPGCDKQKRLQVCACKSALYCSVECQKEDRRRHKPQCDEERRVLSVPTTSEKPLSFKSDYFKFRSEYLGEIAAGTVEVIVL
jgi:hypothetical protein